MLINWITHLQRHLSSWELEDEYYLIKVENGQKIVGRVTLREGEGKISVTAS